MGVRVGGRQGGCIVRLHIVPRAGVGSSANLAALLPPAGEGGAKRRMRGASDASCLAFCLWPFTARSKARFAAPASPHPPSGHLLPLTGEALQNVGLRLLGSPSRGRFIHCAERCPAADVRKPSMKYSKAALHR